MRSHKKAHPRNNCGTVAGAAATGLFEWSTHKINSKINAHISNKHIANWLHTISGIYIEIRLNVPTSSVVLGAQYLNVDMVPNRLKSHATTQLCFHFHSHLINSNHSLLIFQFIVEGASRWVVLCKLISLQIALNFFYIINTPVASQLTIFSAKFRVRAIFAFFLSSVNFLDECQDAIFKLWC